MSRSLREGRGTYSIVQMSLRVRRDALAWWLQRLNKLGVQDGEIVELDRRYALAFEDPEGQRLALVDDGGKGDPPGGVGAQPCSAGDADSRARTQRDRSIVLKVAKLFAF